MSEKEVIFAPSCHGARSQLFSKFTKYTTKTTWVGGTWVFSMHPSQLLQPSASFG